MALTNLPTGDLRILIVDNDPLLRQALRDMLGMWGIRQVSIASDGRDAVDRMRNGKFDLLLTDWLMEPMDGEELLRWVRQAPSSTHHDIPVIVLTGNADLQTVRNAWSAGADCVLAKPVPATTIARRIEAVLTQPRRNTPAGTTTQNSRTVRPKQATPRTGLPGTPPVQKITTTGPRLPRPDGSAQRSPSPAHSPTRSMIRLLLALDRLEATMWLTGAGDVRMQHAVNELRVAASADPTAAIIASSLAACLTWSDPEAVDLDQIVQAHIKGLHQLAAGSIPYGETAALIDRLRTMTKSLLCIDGDGDNLPIFSTAMPGTTQRGGENSPPSA